MNKSDIDWCPSINLGHNKINMNALQAASDRAECMALRQKKMEKAIVSSAVAESFTEDTATGEDTNPRYSNQETTVVSYECKIVQTHRPHFCNISVQTDESDFFDEGNFLVDDAKVHYYTGFTNCDLLRSTFEFVMKKLADG